MKNPTLLCVANHPTGFGFAWTHFEAMYAGLAERMSASGVRTLIAYPKVTQKVAAFDGTAAEVIERDATSNALESIQALARFARHENVRAVLYIDRASMHPWAYGLLRRAGVRRVLVYNQTSGAGYQSALPKQAVKWLLSRCRWMTPDVVIGVSEYVMRREARTWQLPPARLACVHNAMPVPNGAAASPTAHERLGLDPSRPLIVATCRAVPEKGVDHLFRAFGRLLAAYPTDGPRPVLVFAGTGEQMGELEQLRQTLPTPDDILMAGYRADAGELMAGAAVAVVPSVFQDACPFAVLEAMARGCAIVATRVGGVPEMIDSERVGLLVPPSDEAALASALGELLADPARRASMGKLARTRIATVFRPDIQIERLITMIAPAFHEAKSGRSGETTVPEVRPRGLEPAMTTSPSYFEDEPDASEDELAGEV